MRMRTGRTDYGSDMTPSHPFNLRCPKLDRRNLLQFSSRVKRWQWLAGIGIGIILCNGLLMFWLSFSKVPVVFIDTVLSSGKLYQQGVLIEKPLDKHASRKILKLESLNKSEPLIQQTTSGKHLPVSGTSRTEK